MGYVIENFDNLLESEINNFMNKFTPTQLKGEKFGSGFINDYNKQSIEPSNEFINKVKNIILNHLNNYVISYGGARLNLIEKDTNPSDEFHTDVASGNIIFLHYPKFNPYFEGGEFEWIDDNSNNNIVKIKNGMNLILINNPQHRVLNVTSGKRFSFTLFFNNSSSIFTIAKFTYNRLTHFLNTI